MHRSTIKMRRISIFEKHMARMIFKSRMEGRWVHQEKEDMKWNACIAIYSNFLLRT